MQANRNYAIRRFPRCREASDNGAARALSAHETLAAPLDSDASGRKGWARNPRPSWSLSVRQMTWSSQLGLGGSSSLGTPEYLVCLRVPRDAPGGRWHARLDEGGSSGGLSGRWDDTNARHGSGMRSWRGVRDRRLTLNWCPPAARD